MQINAKCFEKEKVKKFGRKRKKEIMKRKRQRSYGRKRKKKLEKRKGKEVMREKKKKEKVKKLLCKSMQNVLSKKR